MWIEAGNEQEWGGELKKASKWSKPTYSPPT